MKRSKREQRGKHNGGNRCEGVGEARMGMYCTQGMGGEEKEQSKSQDVKGRGGGCMQDGGTRMIEMRH